MKMAIDKKELILLHEKIKNHSYRRPDCIPTEKIIREYQKLLYDFLDGVYAYIKLYDGKESSNYKAIKDLFHDFSASIEYVRHYRKSFQFSEAEVHIERCLGTLHRYLDFGKIEIFYTYYYGNNTYKNWNPLCRYILIDGKFKDNRTKAEILSAIKEIEDYKKEHGKFSDLFLYTKEYY